MLDIQQVENNRAPVILLLTGPAPNLRLSTLICIDKKARTGNSTIQIFEYSIWFWERGKLKDPPKRKLERKLTKTLKKWPKREWKSNPVPHGAKRVRLDRHISFQFAKHLCNWWQKARAKLQKKLNCILKSVYNFTNWVMKNWKLCLELGFALSPTVTRCSKNALNKLNKLILRITGDRVSIFWILKIKLNFEN